MHANEEEKQVLGNVHATEDIQELQAQNTTDGPVSRIRPEQIEQFHIITDEMVEILESKDPEVRLGPQVDSTIRFALEALFEARTSRDISTNEFISGLVRNKQLNQALMHLQPVLAMALRPDFPDGRAIYERLVGNVNQLRASIQQSILAQMPVKKAPARRKAEEQDDDEDDGTQDDGSQDGGIWDGGTHDDDARKGSDRAEEEEEEAEPAPGEERGSWLGRLLKRRGRKGDGSATGQDRSPETPRATDKSDD